MIKKWNLLENGSVHWLEKFESFVLFAKKHRSEGQSGVKPCWSAVTCDVFLPAVWQVESDAASYSISKAHVSDGAEADVEEGDDAHPQIQNGHETLRPLHLVLQGKNLPTEREVSRKTDCNSCIVCEPSPPLTFEQHEKEQCKDLKGRISQTAFLWVFHSEMSPPLSLWCLDFWLTDVLMKAKFLLTFQQKTETLLHWTQHSEKFDVLSGLWMVLIEY